MQNPEPILNDPNDALNRHSSGTELFIEFLVTGIVFDLGQKKRSTDEFFRCLQGVNSSTKFGGS